MTVYMGFFYYSTNPLLLLLVGKWVYHPNSNPTYVKTQFLSDSLTSIRIMLVISS